MVSDHLKLDAAQLDPDAEFSEFGFDSITLTSFGNEINRRYGLALAPT
ncbi:acyl carrier protein, partial [Chromobacterium alticapitis]